MDRKQLEALYDNNLRIESILSLGGMQVDGTMADALEEFLATQDPAELEAIFPDLPERFVDGDSSFDSDECRELADWLLFNGYYGYIVQYALPEATYSSATSFSCSWGQCYTRWFYSAAVEDTIPAALKWADGLKAVEKRLFKQKEKA